MLLCESVCTIRLYNRDGIGIDVGGWGGQTNEVDCQQHSRGNRVQLKDAGTLR